MKSALFATALLAVLWPAVARADAEIILLVVDRGSVSAAKRVEAELAAGGFTVVTRTSSEPSDRAALLGEARGINAVATVRVHATGAGAELAIVDRVTGKTLFRDVTPEQATDSAVLATKTTELLRASLLEVRIPEFHPVEVPVPRAAEALVTSAPQPSPPGASVNPRGLLGMGAAVAQGGDLGALGFVAAELRLRLSPTLATGVVLAIPVSQSKLEGAPGSSSQSVSHASVAFDVAPLGFGPRVVPFVGATAGLLWFRAQGVASAPYTSEVANVFSALLGARVGAALRLTPSLDVRAQVAALASLPRPTVRFAGQAVGSLPEPLVEATVLLELAAW